MINITELKKRLLSEAQELSPKQKKIAGAAEPKDKITGADFAALRAKKGMKEDHEVSMAHNSLESIIKSAMELKAKLGSDERNIPGWIQDHITNAENYIDQAAQGFHELSHDDQGEADYDELPNGTEEEPVNDMHNLSLAGLMEDMLGEDDDDDYGSYGDTEIADYDTEYDTGVDEAIKNEIEWISSDFSPIKGVKIKKGDKGEIVSHDTGDQYLVKFNNHRFYAHKNKQFKEAIAETKKKPSAGLTKKQKSAISKKAKAGKDIGKKGKGFEKIAKAAAEKYGSKERGQKVAAAAMWKSAAKKAK